MTQSTEGKFTIWGYPLQSKNGHQVNWFLAIQEGPDGVIDDLYPKFYSELVPLSTAEV